MHETGPHTVYSPSINACVDQCAAYTDDSCVGILYDNLFTNGFENCYLLNVTGSIADSQDYSTYAANFTYAELVADIPTTVHSKVGCELISQCRWFLTSIPVGLVVSPYSLLASTTTPLIRSTGHDFRLSFLILGLQAREVRSSYMYNYKQGY